MKFIKTGTIDKKIIKREMGGYTVHFDHKQIEGGYVCTETILRFWPTYENLCHIIDIYNKENGVNSLITKEEYNNNQIK